MSGAAGASRRMIYPYTLTAKVMQFPWRHYINNTWLWKFWLIGIAVSTPVFIKISSLANSPENVRNFEEAKRKERESHH